MGWILCLAVVCAMGAVSILWALLGWMMPGSRDGLVICFGSPGLPESGFIRRYLFLWDLGLLGSPLLIVDQGLEKPERKRLENLRCCIQVCDPEELSRRLELERNRRDRTGNGNHPGRDQCRGVSEL